MAITRNGNMFLPAKAFAKGPVGLKRDSRGDLVYRLGRTVLEAPPTSVAWYHEQGAWPKPGYPGPSVVVGHISYRGKPGPFYTLARIKGKQTGVLKGDVITVTYSSGDKVSFIVTDVDHPEKLDLPGAKIWNNTQRPVLRLVTCDPTTPFVNGHYTGNVVVYADQMVEC